MMKKLYLLLIIGLFLGSCDFFELDLVENPNNLKPEDTDIDYVLNNAQLSFVYFLNDPDPTNWNGMNKFGMELCRMTYMFGPTYLAGYRTTNMDNVWNFAYQQLLRSIENVIPRAEALNMTNHSGVAKVLKAYTYMTLVDFFGDVPYSEALQGAANFNPHVDDDAVIYNNCLTILDEAIADLEANSAVGLANDLFYNGNTTKWITLAKTLKLKMYLNLRLINSATATTEINSLIAGGDLIDEDDEEFIFNYTANAVDPDCRHPYFTYNYLNGANDYMTNYFMWCCLVEKGVVDPRLRYYFYRQRNTIPTDINVLPCLNAEKPSHYPGYMPFCALTSGYWGRDHLDGDGIPPDTRARTVFGLYPAGGKFDNNDNRQVAATSGAQGAGMEVIMFRSFVEFMKAEAALTLGTTGSARTHLENGIRQSIARVMAFRPDLTNAAYVPTQAAIDLYVTTVLGLYDAAITDAERLEIITKEYYIALFGNGVETFNLVRRTTYPSNLQPALVATPGDFYYTLYYPANCANNNLNIDQKTGVVQVFWDNNPVGAIQ